MCQATCHVVCMHLPRWVGLLGVDGAQAKVSRSVSSTRPVLHFIHHIKSRTPSVTADGEMVRDGIYTHYWMNFKKEKKCQVFKHLNSHFSKFETKFWGVVLSLRGSKKCFKMWVFLLYHCSVMCFCNTFFRLYHCQALCFSLFSGFNPCKWWLKYCAHLLQNQLGLRSEKIQWKQCCNCEDGKLNYTVMFTEIWIFVSLSKYYANHKIGFQAFKQCRSIFQSFYCPVSKHDMIFIPSTRSRREATWVHVEPCSWRVFIPF